VCAGGDVRACGVRTVLYWSGISKPAARVTTLRRAVERRTAVEAAAAWVANWVARAAILMCCGGETAGLLEFRRGVSTTRWRLIRKGV
jgi:hypothetical protein